MMVIGIIAVVCLSMRCPIACAAETPDDEALIAAFAKIHDGYSSDELLIRDDLWDAFVSQLQITQDDAITAAVRRLLTLRKTGRLNVRATRTSDSRPLDDPAIAEIAIRTTTDRQRVSVDDVLTDPALRRQLQAEAEKLRPSVDAAAVRKTILTLRKTRRLRPELVLRVADWKREIRTLAVDNLDLDSIPHRPGVYVFRNQDGYLYVGEAKDLNDRLTEHVAGSHNAALASALRIDDGDLTVELHIFPSDSPAARVTVRRAYESELIRSREPAFNLRP